MHVDRPAAEIVQSALPLSRYAQRLLESEPELLAELEQNVRQPFLREQMQAFLFTQSVEANDEARLLGTLRSLRKRVLLRVAIRDLSGLADLTEVMAGMTNLAEETIR